MPVEQVDRVEDQAYDCPGESRQTCPFPLLDGVHSFAKESQSIAGEETDDADLSHNLIRKT